MTAGSFEGTGQLFCGQIAELTADVSIKPAAMATADQRPIRPDSLAPAF